MITASTIRLSEYKRVTVPVRVSTMGTSILLSAVPQEQEDGTTKLVPNVPEGSIFQPGKVLLQFGEGWYLVDGLDIDKYPMELVVEFDNTGGSLRQKQFFSVRGVDNNLLKMLRFGKTAKPETVLEVMQARATQALVTNMLTPPAKGVGIWTPWDSTQRIQFDQVAMGVELARKFWKLIVKAAKREGKEIDKSLARLVYDNPALLNDVQLFVNRQPVHDSECLMVMRIIVTDNPTATIQVTPELMKAMLGDRDGDGASAFTFERSANISDLLNQVKHNVESGASTEIHSVFGLDFHSGSSMGTKGTEKVDVSLGFVTYDKGNTWSDFQGFKTKGVVGLLCSEIWQYSWAMARLLTTEQLIELATESYQLSNPRRAEHIARLVAKLVASTGSRHARLRAQLATELTFRMFGPMMEHIFDARKGVKLGYDPIAALKALSRTGRFDWAGMESEEIWTSPLKLIAPKLWAPEIGVEGNMYLTYSLRRLIEQHDPIYHTLVSARTKGWKVGFDSINTLADLIREEGIDPILKSLYLQGDVIPVEEVAVPASLMEAEDQGELVDILATAKMGRKFVSGPSTITEMIRFCREYGLNIKLSLADDGGIYLNYREESRYLGTFTIRACNKFYGEKSPYVGHIIESGTTRRACPMILIHDVVNPFMDGELKLKKGKKNSKFPGINPDKFSVLNFYGVLAHLIVGAKSETRTDKQFIQRAAARVRSFIDKCELVRNEPAEAVFSDMLKVEYRKEGIPQDWVAGVEDAFALAAYEANFSLYTVSKNDPMSKFMYNGPHGVPAIIEAYDPFWMIGTRRRMDREALSVLRNMVSIANPVTPNVTGVNTDLLAKHRQMVRLAFFNTEYNAGGHDPVDFTPSGMANAESDEVEFLWMTKSVKDEYLEGLTKEERQKAFGLIYAEMEKGNTVSKEVQIDETIYQTHYKVPVHLGGEDTEKLTFKGNFPGTKSMVSPMGVQLIASFTPIKTYKGFVERLSKTGNTRTFFVDGVMPSDTIVGKKAWSLIAGACASQLEDGFKVETTNPDEVITQVIPAISARLKEEGKSPDGKMYIYRLDGETITPLKDGTKTLKAVCGLVPMYRTNFKTSFGNSMSKLRGDGLDKVGHSERTLVGEPPIITQEMREEMAILLRDMEVAGKSAAPIRYDEDDFTNDEPNEDWF